MIRALVIHGLARRMENHQLFSGIHGRLGSSDKRLQSSNSTSDERRASWKVAHVCSVHVIEKQQSPASPRLRTRDDVGQCCTSHSLKCRIASWNWSLKATKKYEGFEPPSFTFDSTLTVSSRHHLQLTTSRQIGPSHVHVQ